MTGFSIPILAWQLALLALAIMCIVSLLTSSKFRRKTLSLERELDQARTAHKAQMNELQNRSLTEIDELRKKSSAEIDALRSKYLPIISMEDELAKLHRETQKITDQIELQKLTYREKRMILLQLESQIAIYDERLAFSELGLYEPHFGFDSSEDYKKRINEVRERQKQMISSKAATICPVDWSVEGSRSKGEVMKNRQSRLTMRAFNNECEAAVANVRWNNATAMEKRILAAVNAIDRENASLNLTINGTYVKLKIEELRLVHEYREQLKRERDERAELVRFEREERKLLAEAESAEKEEQKYAALLDKARKEALAEGSSEAMRRRIESLETALAEAHTESERARAMAEMTKSGFIYIISNIGSFGDDVVKIGLTRRLDPDDRVRELGDASVPFGFDIHAMIYSEEAPSLEYALHREFADKRINTVNMRKEFFRVDLEAVEEAVARLAPQATFFRDREAQEWHETLARRREALAATAALPSASFPTEI